MTMTIHAESVGGTPAARMIHEESQQLFIGHYVIDKQGKVRVISPSKMPARVTAFMRHLKDPKNFVYLYDMENMFYEVNVHSLEFKNSFMIPFPDIMVRVASLLKGKVVVSKMVKPVLGTWINLISGRSPKNIQNEALKTVAVSLLMMVKNGK